MPQLASLSWLFLSIIFIFLLLLVCVSLWWLNYSKVFSCSSDLSCSFNSWDW